jgi:hypothetical protein
MRGLALMSLEPFAFPHRPLNQRAIELSKDRLKGRLPVLPVVVDPTSNDRIRFPGQIVQVLAAPQVKSPAPHLVPHRHSRLIAHRRGEADEVRRRPASGRPFH